MEIMINELSLTKAIADDVRWEIMEHLCCVWLSVNDVVEKLDGRVYQPTVSHHLKKLREAGLITSERRGTWVYCRVAPGVLSAMARMLDPLE